MGLAYILKRILNPHGMYARGDDPPSQLSCQHAIENIFFKNKFKKILEKSIKNKNS